MMSYQNCSGKQKKLYSDVQVTPKNYLIPVISRKQFVSILMTGQGHEIYLQKGWKINCQTVWFKLHCACTFRQFKHLEAKSVFAHLQILINVFSVCNHHFCCPLGPRSLCLSSTSHTLVPWNQNNKLYQLLVYAAIVLYFITYIFLILTQFIPSFIHVTAAMTNIL
jgi:hypothetical protein